MPLKLYRRHRLECEGGHREESRSGEFEERSKKSKRCSCQIFASGTLGGRFKRQRTGKSTWEEAKAVVAAWEAARSRGTQPAPEAQPSPAPESGSERVTIADATKAFLAVRASSKIAPSTLRKYRTFIKQLRTLADAKGYVMLDQFTRADIDVFYANWTLGARAKGKALGTLRGFFALDREWIPKSPVTADLKPPLGANHVANKVPFTDEDLQRITDACDRIAPVQWTNGQRQGEWSGEDVKDFIWVLAYTGLRISDVALFHMDRMKGNEVFLRAQKNGGDIFTWLPFFLPS